MTGAGRSLAALHLVADPLFRRRHGSEEGVGGTACTVAAMIEPTRDGDGAARGTDSVRQTASLGQLQGDRGQLH
jgi:hypothetical protein